MTESKISFSHVSKCYDDNIVLNDVNFEIQTGEFITVVGRSGCGKTTLLRLINGLLQPDHGTVAINGKDITFQDPITLRRSIGYVIQGIGLFSHLNIKRNIEFIPCLLKYDKKRCDEISRRLISVVGLPEEMLSRYPSELSGGQQQRIGIARALAASPDIVLMDEPFGALDEMTRNYLQNEIKKIQQELNLTIIFITHDLKEAAKLGDRIFIMNRGKIVMDTTPEKTIRIYEKDPLNFFGMDS